jgi:hypothetical protein
MAHLDPSAANANTLLEGTVSAVAELASAIVERLLAVADGRGTVDELRVRPVEVVRGTFSARCICGERGRPVLSRDRAWNREAEDRARAPWTSRVIAVAVALSFASQESTRCKTRRLAEFERRRFFCDQDGLLCEAGTQPAWRPDRQREPALRVIIPPTDQG